MRYLGWDGDGEAVQPEKGYGVENCLRFAAESPASGSIFKRGHGRSMSGRSSGKTVVQQDRRVRKSGDPEQLQGHKDRILAWDQLHYTKRRSE